MEDIYSALIGEGAGKGERAALIAAALRRRNEMGQLGQITGDRALAPVGKGLSQSADDYAEMLQQIRQNDARGAQTERYQTGQLDHMANSLAETKRANDLEHQYRMAMARAANTKADRPPGTGKIPKLRQGDIKEMQDLSESIGIVQGLEGFLDAGGKFGAVEVLKGPDGKGLPIPLARTMANYAASKGYGSDENKATFLAKQNWDKMYTLAERNRLFGATLTANEQKAWADASPSSNQTDEQIRKALPIMRKAFEHRMKSKAAGLMKEGYSAEALADYTDVPGVNLPGTLEDGTTVGATQGEGTPPGAPSSAGKRLRKVNGKWVPVDGL